MAGENTDVSGTGSQSNPYVISAATEVNVDGGGGNGGVARIVGEIIAYGGIEAPAGWLICDGAEVSRAVYSDLFTVLGTVYGGGDGSTTFNLPDLSERVPRGAGGAAARGDTVGADEVALTASHLPAHAHSMNHGHTTNTTGSHDHGITHSSGTGNTGQNIPLGTNLEDRQTRAPILHDGDHAHTVSDFVGNTGSQGANAPVSIIPSAVTVNFIIKV